MNNSSIIDEVYISYKTSSSFRTMLLDIQCVVKTKQHILEFQRCM